MTENIKIRKMQYTEHNNNGTYHCDLKITKEQWIECLNDESVIGNAKDTLISFYRSPKHKNTCKSIANGLSPQIPNGNIRGFGERVGKRLNVSVISTDGQQTYWLIPMKEGKTLTDGLFEWTLRDELAEAIKEWLILDLLKRYKNKFINVSLIGPYKENEQADEIYKWQLVTVSQGKAPIRILEDHCKNPGKHEKGGFVNLIDAQRDNKTLKYLLENKREQMTIVLDRLADENTPLEQRLADYKVSVAQLLPAEGYGSKANDERTAAAFLACFNPKKYTFYKDEIYKNYCRYINEEPKKTGEKYPHYLQLLEPLAQAIRQDKELLEKIQAETHPGIDTK